MTNKKKDECVLLIGKFREKQQHRIGRVIMTTSVFCDAAPYNLRDSDPEEPAAPNFGLLHEDGANTLL
jgi:hypothetical protein